MPRYLEALAHYKFHLLTCPPTDGRSDARPGQVSCIASRGQPRSCRPEMEVEMNETRMTQFTLTFTTRFTLWVTQAIGNPEIGRSEMMELLACKTPDWAGATRLFPARCVTSAAGSLQPRYGGSVIGFGRVPMKREARAKHGHRRSGTRKVRISSCIFNAPPMNPSKGQKRGESTCDKS